MLSCKGGVSCNFSCAARLYPVVDGNAIETEVRESGTRIAPDIAALSVVGTLSLSIRVTQGLR